MRLAIFGNEQIAIALTAMPSYFCENVPNLPPGGYGNLIKAISGLFSHVMRVEPRNSILGTEPFYMRSALSVKAETPNLFLETFQGAIRNRCFS
jgi:hypothetical protein